jgi:LuxR family maltose regulon positive regulatory protein
MLNSKITIPHLSRTFQRTRLHGLLQQLPRKRLTLVVGGAGYGKTTLIANTIRHQKLQAVWYNLDGTDQDFSTFIAYLLHGFKSYLQGMEVISAALQSAPLRSPKQRMEILEKLVHHLEKNIDFELILVLDDFHLVQNKPEICESIEFMLKHLPPFIHLVLVSRSEPAIRISRLRVMDDVTEVRESDMTFTLEEIEGLSSDIFNLRLEPASLKQIKTKTNGWAASLILCLLVLRDKPDEAIEKLLNGITGSHKLIFTYLEENVFDSQPPIIKQFMMKTALLDQLDPDFCDTYLEIDNSRALLEQLTANHLLTSKDESGGLYSYHHLLKEFLRTKLRKETDDKGLQDQYLKIARLLETRGEGSAAIKYYLGGNHFSLAAQRLLDVEEDLFHSGQINRIRDFLKQFPKTMLEKSPGLAYINAKIHSYSGNQFDAIVLFKRALNGFRQEKFDRLVMDCQIHLGLNYYYTGHIKKAETFLENCMKTGGGMRTLEIAGLLIIIPAILGNPTKADAYVDMAHGVLAGLEGPLQPKMETWIKFCVSYRHFCSGDFQKAYDLGLDVFKRFQCGHTTVIMPLACLHVALPAYFLGRPETGLDYAGKGLQRLEQMDIRDNQVGWLNYALALNLCGLNRLDEALAHARQSLDLFKRQSCYWGQATTYDLMHFIHRKMECLDEAQRDLVNGLKILEIADLPLTWAILEIGRLSLLIDKRQFDGVRQHLSAVKDKVRGSFFYTFKVNLLASRLEWCNGQTSRALGYLKAAYGMAAKYGYERHFTDHGGWIHSLIEVLPDEEIHRTWVQRLLEIQKKAIGPGGFR